MENETLALLCNDRFDFRHLGLVLPGLVSLGCWAQPGRKPIALIAIPIIIAMNYGIWLVPIIPVTIFEVKKSSSIKFTALAGILTWCCAIFSYYTYYWILLSLGKLNLQHNWRIFWWIILSQFLEWLSIAIIGGGLVGVIVWWLLHNRKNHQAGQALN